MKNTVQTVLCSQCETPLRRKKHRVAKFVTFFCSPACMSAYRRASAVRGKDHPQFGRVTMPCDACGEPVHKWPSKVRVHNFCNRSCHERWQRESGYISGENSPTWRGGHVDHRGPNWPVQRNLALHRDNYRCVACGATEPLQVHHKRPYQLFGDYKEANALTNLETLCNKHHTVAEWEYRHAHPDELRLIPSRLRLNACRKCGREYVARNHRSLDCDDCAPKNRASRRVPSSS